jgi:hypothetical protein
MTNLQRSDQAKAYPLARFFVTVYFISWVLWIPVALSSQGIIPIQLPVLLAVVIGGISPSLTAVVLTIVEEGKDGIRSLYLPIA